MALLQTFLAVALRPDKSVGELARDFGVANGTISRLLSDLSDLGRSGDPGLGLIDQSIYHYEGRHTPNRLSVKGAAMDGKITAVPTRQPMAKDA